MFDNIRYSFSNFYEEGRRTLTLFHTAVPANSIAAVRSWFTTEIILVNTEGKHIQTNYHPIVLRLKIRSTRLVTQLRTLFQPWCQDHRVILVFGFYCLFVWQKLMLWMNVSFLNLQKCCFMITGLGVAKKIIIVSLWLTGISCCFIYIYLYIIIFNILIRYLIIFLIKNTEQKLRKKHSGKHFALKTELHFHIVYMIHLNHLKLDIGGNCLNL